MSYMEFHRGHVHELFLQLFSVKCIIVLGRSILGGPEDLNIGADSPKQPSAGAKEKGARSLGIQSYIHRDN